MKVASKTPKTSERTYKIPFIFECTSKTQKVSHVGCEKYELLVNSTCIRLYQAYAYIKDKKQWCRLFGNQKGRLVNLVCFTFFNFQN